MAKNWREWVQECFHNKKICYGARCLPDKNDRACVECYEIYVTRTLSNKEDKDERDRSS